MGFEIIQGDCLEVLREMPSASVDAVVTDPPYGLAFMGKKWDYDVPSVAIWEECLRVLKPGGHLVAFAGTRTQHRMACRIEDAGFEIRDMLAWCYGTGFPKSMDVSKAIDRMDASEEQERRRLRFTAWVRSTGITSRQIDEATGTNMGGHYTTAASQPAIMTREHLEACRHLLGNVPAWIEREADIRSVESRNMAAREVVGEKGSGLSGGSGNTVGRFTDSRNSNGCVDITAPATEAAKQWHGWGTALKPAIEPITLARKPFRGTVAGNVLEHGTGALNVEACRLEPSGESSDRDGENSCEQRYTHNGATRFAMKPGQRGGDPSGRWPANLLHDGSREIHDALGDDRRLFYCAKASQEERNAGLDDLNHHPTVKPVALMRWLCRLVTQPGGLVLDPFTGSGTTGIAAVEAGFRFLGIEREPEYVEIARRRCAHAAETRQPELFDEVPA